MNEFPQPPAWVLDRLRDGLVIPAHPLALTRQRKLDERRQRALARYYLAAGAGGLAVGVHTTQFAIREPKHGLLRRVLELAARTASEQTAGKAYCPSVAQTSKSAVSPTSLSAARGHSRRSPGAGLETCDTADLEVCATRLGNTFGTRQPVLIAGVCGRTPQAVAEAQLAREVGYHAGLLSLGGLRDASERELIAHCRTVAHEIPLVGFYLQPAAGGCLLPLTFWRRFVEIPNVIAVKIAPFNRYQTLDVVRAVAEAGRARDIALYTGNDDHILLDLLTEWAVPTGGGIQRLRIVGGLLGQWACWTRAAVELLERCKRLRACKRIPAELLTLAEQLTDANAAVFDAAHGFTGCIAGIHEVLRRQGLLANTLCLDPQERLSPGQAEEITRVCAAYPALTDDEYVKANLQDWLDG
jgi:dihydrodipicolinate synthase/N-acetylneuraminate lyase